MSDNLRKDFTTKASESLKPEQEKSGFEQLKEKVTDTVDSAMGKAEGQSGEKSYTQQAADKLSSK